MAASTLVTFPPVLVGDVRPIAILVNPSDTAKVTLATYNLFQRGITTAVIANGATTVTNDNHGSTITTVAPYTFGVVGNFICRFVLTWDDGQKTNVSVAIQVLALPSA